MPLTHCGLITWILSAWYVAIFCQSYKTVLATINMALAGAVQRTLNVKTLRLGDKRRTPDKVVAAIARTSTTSSSRHLHKAWNASAPPSTERPTYLQDLYDFDLANERDLPEIED